MPNLLFCVGKAVADVGLAELAAVAGGDPLVAAGLVAKVAAAAWKQWREDKKQDKLNEDVLDAAKKSFEEAKQAAIDVARQVTPDPELQGYVERFVTLVPASIRASLRSPKDPTGTSVPDHFAIHDPDDLVKLLPARLPRFKAGDTPAFLRGWRLIEQIGAGGFGEVWKAQNTRAGNLVNAVKFGHGLSEAEQTLLNEGDVLNRILAEGHHDGIVKLLDVWADGDAVPWLRYEYIAGGDLAAVITVWQTLPVEQRLAKVLAALGELTATAAHFHALRPFIVHRDLKPSNILYDPKAGRFKIADFGIGGVSAQRSLIADVSKSLTAGAVVASYLRGSHTPLYASPEQRAGGRALDPRDDVHALGVIAYQMLTGKLDAAPGTDVEDDLKSHGVPGELIALVKSCTARDPNRRPKDAGELNARLQAVPLPQIPAALPEVIPPTADLTAEAVVDSFPCEPSTAPAVVAVLTMPVADPTPTPSESPSVVGGIWGKVKRLFGGKKGERTSVAAIPHAVSVADEPDEQVEPPRNESQLAQRDAVSDLLVPPTQQHTAGEQRELELPGGVQMTFAWCPPGSFMMGSEVGWEEPVRRVNLSNGFFVGIHPVTLQQWKAVMGTNPSHRTDAPTEDLMRPVRSVSWDDANDFCACLARSTGLSIRLPTEAEWEYACRAGTTTEYHWGNAPGRNRMSCLDSDSSSVDVMLYRPNPWGLFDCHGNVHEWCQDWFDADYYERAPATDPLCKDGEMTSRVARGGSGLDSAKDCGSASRMAFEAGDANFWTSFRVVFNLD